MDYGVDSGVSGVDLHTDWGRLFKTGWINASMNTNLKLTSRGEIHCESDIYTNICLRHFALRNYALSQMADGLGPRLVHQPFRPRLKLPTQSEMADAIS